MCAQPISGQPHHRSLFDHCPHPRLHHRPTGPTKVSEQLPAGSRAARFNSRLALRITTAVGSMWCAYLFVLLTLPALPGAINAGALGIVTWTAQTLIQLVLLPVILVGQNVQAAAADKRADDTYRDAEAILHEALQVQAHLTEQDKVLLDLLHRATPAGEGAPS